MSNLLYAQMILDVRAARKDGGTLDEKERVLCLPQYTVRYKIYMHFTARQVERSGHVTDSEAYLVHDKAAEHMWQDALAGPTPQRLRLLQSWLEIEIREREQLAAKLVEDVHSL